VLSHAFASFSLFQKLWLKALDLVWGQAFCIKAVLIGIFAFVALNALTCAMGMFLPYKRTVIMETLVDILYVCFVGFHIHGSNPPLG
jgi:hypothetical protein